MPRTEQSRSKAGVASAAKHQTSFATPDREQQSDKTESMKHNTRNKRSTRSSSRIEAAAATTTNQEDVTTPTAVSNITVTPPESNSRDGKEGTAKHKDDAGEKHVRFGRHAMTTKDNDKEEKERKSKRGLVSRRGGRYGSPGRMMQGGGMPSLGQPSKDILEFKTYRSPQRNKKDDSDTVPTLCSAGSGLSSGPLGGKTDNSKSTPVAKEDTKPAARVASADAPSDGRGRPSSISLDASMIDTTSPLAPHDVENSPLEGTANRSAASRKPADAPPTNFKAEQDGQAGKRNVTFSPPPPPSDPMRLAETPRKTPSKSPSAGKFHTLPSLSESKMASPAGIFLSPSPPHPSLASKLKPVPSFELEDHKDSKNGDSKLPADLGKDGGKENDYSARDQERERVVATPTDFTFDFGKGHHQTASFDASNVLAWLQSPTANGMFSPGGLLSVANTPRGATAPRTPRTPQVSTSFFFSDVASLPRNSEFGSPRAEAAAKRDQAGYSNSMICISPVASRRVGNGPSGRAGRPGDSLNSTPYRDVFASPRHIGETRVRGLPLLGDSPGKQVKGRSGSRSSGDGNLEGVHMAERDLMEDEDLSVLLQLASHSTPRSARDVTLNAGSHVFRSGGDRKIGMEASASLPGLQLPVIGGQSEGGTKLAQKSSARDAGGANDFTPPPLAIRSSSSGGSKEIFFGKGGSKAHADKLRTHSREDDKKRSSIKGDAASKRASGENGPVGNTSYTIPGALPRYPPVGPEMPPYYPIPGSIPGMPPGGSMRVVVGGPPPMPKDTGGSPARHAGGSPHRPHYADGKFTRPPHYHPMYAPHPMSGMPHYYPPHPHPGHMMYPGPPHGAGKGGALAPKKGRGTKGPGKRLGDSKDTPAKKPRKSPNKAGRKRKTSSVADPAERQKVAAAIKAMNAASGGSNEKAANLAAAIMRGVTMRPSGKWQAQLYYAGKSRYIGVFDTREKAALAYEIAREKLKEGTIKGNSEQSLKATEAAVNLARKAAFEGVNERDPRVT